MISERQVKRELNRNVMMSLITTPGGKQAFYMSMSPTRILEVRSGEERHRSEPRCSLGQQATVLRTVLVVFGFGTMLARSYFP